jgi:hypothetical protein
MTDSKHSHRSHGDNVVPRSSWIEGGLAILVFLLLLAVGNAWDTAAELEEAMNQEQLHHAAERGDAERAWSARVAHAYEQGQRDAMQAITERPEGIALAQACAAWQQRNETAPSRRLAAARNHCTGA